MRADTTQKQPIFSCFCLMSAPQSKYVARSEFTVNLSPLKIARRRGLFCALHEHRPWRKNKLARQEIDLTKNAIMPLRSGQALNLLAGGPKHLSLSNSAAPNKNGAEFLRSAPQGILLCLPHQAVETIRRYTSRRTYRLRSRCQWKARIPSTYRQVSKCRSVPISHSTHWHLWCCQDTR